MSYSHDTHLLHGGEMTSTAFQIGFWVTIAVGLIGFIIDCIACILKPKYKPSDKSSGTYHDQKTRF